MIIDPFSLFKLLPYLVKMLWDKIFKWRETKLRAEAENYFQEAYKYRNFCMVLPPLVKGESRKESDIKKYEEYKELHFKNLELYFDVFLKSKIKPAYREEKKLKEFYREEKTLKGENWIKGLRKCYSEAVIYSDTYKHFLEKFEKFGDLGGEEFSDKVKEIIEKIKN